MNPRLPDCNALLPNPLQALRNGSIKRVTLFFFFFQKKGGQTHASWLIGASGCFLFRGSVGNDPSVKLVGLKARGPAPLGPATQWNTVNYFTLIVPSCNFSCFPMQAEAERAACFQIRNFLHEHECSVDWTLWHLLIHKPTRNDVRLQSQSNV